MYLKFDFGLVRGLLFSRSSNRERALLELAMATYNLEICSLHCLSCDWRGLIFLQSTVAALELLVGLFQVAVTTSMKPGWLIQNDSNLNSLHLGMEVWIYSTQGVWSDTGLPRGLTRVLGYVVVQLLLVRNQSNCSSSGSTCMLLHVKERPLIGSSIRLCVLMKSLNVTPSVPKFLSYICLDTDVPNTKTWLNTSVFGQI